MEEYLQNVFPYIDFTLLCKVDWDVNFFSFSLLMNVKTRNLCRLGGLPSTLQTEGNKEPLFLSLMAEAPSVVSDLKRRVTIIQFCTQKNILVKSSVLYTVE